MPLSIHNITPIIISNTSVLITWDIVQRNENAKFCKIWRKGTKRQRTFKWTLQILKWINWISLSNDPEYEDIKMKEHYSSNEGTYINLSKTQCNNQSYLLTGLSPFVYYKFQMTAEKINITGYDDGKLLANASSHIYYFGRQS